MPIPIDWHSWGDEAFEKIKQKNKPVFSSTGLFVLIGAMSIKVTNLFVLIL
jgi:hypothetical protein